MFSAIGRFFRAVGYFFTGKVDKQTDKLQRDPNVIKATFDKILRDKKASMQEYMSAVAQLIAQETKKAQMVKKLGEEVARLRNLQAGAGGKAKLRAADLKAKGVHIEVIKTDAEILTAKAAFGDFGSTLEEKEQRIEELEGDVAGYRDRIKNHKIQLQSLQRDMEKIKDEAADTRADVITAVEEKQLNDVLMGISEDGTGAELERMREMRNQAKAEASIASQLAGTDSKRLEAEYANFAATHQANDAFDDLLGLDESGEDKMARIEEKLDRSASAPVADGQ